MEHKYFGGAEFVQRPGNDGSIEAMIERALRPLAAAVGLDEATLSEAIDRDMSRRVARSAFDDLEQEGVRLQGARVLDLGAGLGHASVEAATRGCDVTALEPGIEWCEVVRRRLGELGTGEAIVGDGERLPFAENTFDVIVSIGVLEHVRRPAVYLSEAYRVLKPGGAMFLSCENYMSFWEPHYRVAWLPLFPKPLAALYLRLRGRSSDFLMSSITYTTRLGVNRRMRAIGFGFRREARLRAKLKAKGVATWAVGSAARVIFAIENWRQFFTPYYATIVQKPASAV